MKDAKRPKKAPQPSLKGQQNSKTKTTQRKTTQMPQPSPTLLQTPKTSPTLQKTSTRLPRTVDEVNKTYANAGSKCCVQCTSKHIKCRFKNNAIICVECSKHGGLCQPLFTSWKRSKENSSVGKRTACISCFKKKKKCVYDEADEYQYDVVCRQCKESKCPCWPNVSFRGVQGTKILSGVDYSFVSDSNLGDRVENVTLEAINNFWTTVDVPMNNGPLISTKRPARSRNNYGLISSIIDMGHKQYCNISSYGSGCGSFSVGTTSK